MFNWTGKWVVGISHQIWKAEYIVKWFEVKVLKIKGHPAKAIIEKTPIKATNKRKLPLQPINPGPLQQPANQYKRIRPKALINNSPPS
jgi:hypothetical protein